MSTTTILAIDDEQDLLELLRYNLEKEGFDVLLARDALHGLELARQHRPNVIVLDIMMPGMNGLELCRQLRRDPALARLPIIMLTAKAGESDRVAGLETGADDYITKPFSPRELIARVRAVLRRVTPEQSQRQILCQGRLIIDVAARQISYDGKQIGLTATEFRILSYLASRPGRVFSRDQIIDTALGQDSAVVDRTIDVHINSLRKKLGAGAVHIETVRGFGYKFLA